MGRKYDLKRAAALRFETERLHDLFSKDFDSDAARRAVDAIGADVELIDTLFEKLDNLFPAIGCRAC